jgi:hypothetical protein
MKRTFQTLLAITALLAAAPLSVHAADSPGYVDFGKFTAPANGGEFVEVNVGSNLISLAAQLVEKLEPDAAKLLRSVQGVRVTVVGLTDENRADLEKRVRQIRSGLETQGWDRVVTAQQKDEDVGIYVKTRGGEALAGVTITVFNPKKEAVFINVLGDIKPEQVAALGEQLNIKPLKDAAAALKK